MAIEDYGLKTGDTIAVRNPITDRERRAIVTFHDGSMWADYDDGGEERIGVLKEHGWIIDLRVRPTPDPIAAVLDDPDLQYAFWDKPADFAAAYTKNATGLGFPVLAQSKVNRIKFILGYMEGQGQAPKQFWGTESDFHPIKRG